MRIIECYKYRKDNKVHLSDLVPEGAEVLETLLFLEASIGCVLVTKETKEEIGKILLLEEGDTFENYEETEIAEGEDG